MPRPVLNVLIPYAVGIFVGGFFSIPILWIWLIVLTCFIGSLALRSVRKHDLAIQQFQQISPSYVLLQVALFTSGMLHLEIRLTSPIPSDFYDQRVRFLKSVRP